MNPRQDGNRKTRIRLFATLAALLLVAVLGWWILSANIRADLHQRLSELGWDEVRIGRVGFGWNGVVATNIEFHSDGLSQPALTVERLSILQPILDLILDRGTLARIEIEGVRWSINFNEPLMEPPKPVDIQALEIPAERILLNDAAVTLRHPQRDDLRLDGITLEVVKSGRQVTWQGRIDDFIDGRWSIGGKLDANRKLANLTVASDRVELKDQSWTRWPGIPEELADSLAASGSAAVDITVKAARDRAPAWTARFVPRDFQVAFAAIDLNLHLNDGTIVYNDGELNFTSVQASSDGRDRLILDGNFLPNASPQLIDFQVGFEEVSSDTWRQLVPALPLEVKGRCTGNASGRISVDDQLQTNIRISARADSSSLQYGDIVADDSILDVEIDALEFDRQFGLKVLTGNVDVTASLVDQPVDRVFSTFDLAELKENLGVEATSDGDVNLSIPLATADEIDTWDLGVTANAAEGKIFDQAVSGLEATVRMQRGRLVFKPLLAQVSPSGQTDALNTSGRAESSDGRIHVVVDWPLVDEAPDAERARIEIQTDALPASWLAAARMYGPGDEPQGGDEPADQSTQPPTVDWIERRLNANPIGGELNFKASLDLAAKDPADLNRWTGKGQFEPSRLTAAGEELLTRQADLTLNDSVLNLANLRAQVSQGGEITGDATIDLRGRRRSAVNLKADRVSLNWLAAMAMDLSPPVARALRSSQFDLDQRPTDLAGDLQMSLQAEFPWPSAATLAEWQVELDAESKQLMVRERPLKDVQLSVRSAEGAWEVRELTAQLGQAGHFNGRAQGTWGKAATGSASLEWDQLSLAELMKMVGIAPPTGLAGRTSGRLDLSQVQPVRINANSEGESTKDWQLGGDVALHQISWGDWQSPTIRFAVRSRDRDLLIDQVKLGETEEPVDIAGQVTMERPYPYQFSSSIKELDLSKLVQFINDEYARQAIPVSKLAGRLSANMTWHGEWEAGEWQTEGELAIEEVAIRGQSYSPIRARWSHNSDEWSNSTLRANILGGDLALERLSSDPEQLVLKLNGVEATELASMSKLPVAVTGQLNGEATLRSWSDPKQRTAILQLQGASSQIAQVSVNHLQGKLALGQGKIEYSVSGDVLGGRLSGQGTTAMETKGKQSMQFPFAVKLNNVQLGQLHNEAAYYRFLRPFKGVVSAEMELVAAADQPLSGKGRVQLNEVYWQNKLVSRRATSALSLGSGLLELTDLQAGLQRGNISGQVRLPVGNQRTGDYDLNFRQVDLATLLSERGKKQRLVTGIAQARVAGKIGRKISGTAQLGIDRADFFGVTGQAVRVPLRFEVDPLNQAGRIELRRSRIRLLGGSVSGKAQLDFGSRFNIDVDARLADLHTDKMSDRSGWSGDGQLSGHLVIKGRNVRGPRDLQGSFNGKLVKAQSFKFPLLEELALFLNSNQLPRRRFDSEDIELKLAKGRVQVKKLNFRNELAKVALRGDIYLDRRLDLQVAARLERLNRPSLLEEFQDSPLTANTPVIGFADRVAEFLSERLVFVQVSGTVDRPRFQLDPGRQIREELIRFFLRELNIPQLSDMRDN